MYARDLWKLEPQQVNFVLSLLHSGQKRPLAAHPESCLDLQKMLLTLPFFDRFKKNFVYPYFGMLRTHFWQKN